MPDSSAGRQRRILIIDGDPLNASVLQPHFSQQGFEVQVCDSGTNGLNQALAQPPALILLAVSLPDGPGLDVFRQLRQRPRLSHIPVMFMAEHAEARQQNTILSAGADDFIVKPYDVD